MGSVTSTVSSTSIRSSCSASSCTCRSARALLTAPRAWPTRWPASLRAWGGRAPISRFARASGERSPTWSSRTCLSASRSGAATMAAIAASRIASTSSAFSGVTSTGSYSVLGPDMAPFPRRLRGRADCRSGSDGAAPRTRRRTRAAGADARRSGRRAPDIRGPRTDDRSGAAKSLAGVHGGDASRHRTRTAPRTPRRRACTDLRRRPGPAASSRPARASRARSRPRFQPHTVLSVSSSWSAGRYCSTHPDTRSGSRSTITGAASADSDWR